MRGREELRRVESRKGELRGAEKGRGVSRVDFIIRCACGQWILYNQLHVSHMRLTCEKCSSQCHVDKRVKLEHNILATCE